MGGIDLSSINNMLKEVYSDKIVDLVYYGPGQLSWTGFTYDIPLPTPTKYQVWAEKIRQAAVARAKPPPSGSSWVDWT